jgi:hypothetical protein
VFGGPRSVAGPDLPSREVATPCRVLSLETLAPVLLRRSPHALHPCGLGFRVFTLQAPEKQVNDSRDPLMGFGSPSEVAQAPSRCHEHPVSQTPDARSETERQLAAPPLRFRPLQRFPAQGSGMNGWDCISQPPAPSGYRNLLAPSSAPSLPGLVSCRIRSWDHPPELSSSRAAVRCLQRRSPLGVQTAFRVLLHAGVRHSAQRFRLKLSAWLSWVFSPPGFSFSLRWTDLHRSSPHVVTSSDASGR